MAPPAYVADHHETRADPLPAVACTMLGFDGGATGTTGLEGVDVGPVPTALWARTVNVWAVPLWIPVSVQASGPPVQVQVVPCGVAVTVYEVIGLPPFVGAVHVTVADSRPAVAWGAAGCAGTIGGGWVVAKAVPPVTASIDATVTTAAATALERSVNLIGPPWRRAAPRCMRLRRIVGCRSSPGSTVVFEEIAATRVEGCSAWGRCQGTPAHRKISPRSVSTLAEVSPARSRSGSPVGRPPPFPSLAHLPCQYHSMP